MAATSALPATAKQAQLEGLAGGVKAGAVTRCKPFCHAALSQHPDKNYDSACNQAGRVVLSDYIASLFMAVVCPIT